MLSRQKQVLEAFLRTRQFLERDRPAEATPAWDTLVQQFGEVVDRATRASATQNLGQRLSRAATRRVGDAVRRLRQLHLKPIVAIARASAEVVPGIDRALRLPRRRTPVTILMAEARALRNLASEHEALMLSMGRAPDFIAQLDAALDHLALMVRERNDAESLQVGATAAIAAHLRRARQLLTVLGAQLSVYYQDDTPLLAEWQAMSRVQARPGPAIGASKEEQPAEAGDPQVFPITLQAAA